ncbi:UV-resistance, partial [Limosilactobacillus fermentum]
MFTDDEPHGMSFLIDNKSYASCEAVARGLNPLKWPLNKLL